MNPYIEIFPLLLKEEAYKEFRPYIELGKKEDKEIHTLYKALDNVYSDEYRETNADMLQVVGHRAYRDAPTSHYQNLQAIILTLRGLLDAGENKDVLSLLHSIKTRSLYSQLGEECFRLSSGDGNVERFRSIQDDINRYSSNVDGLSPSLENIVDKDLNELFSSTLQTPGLRWRLTSLNKSLGSIRKGNFLFVFARPETGKTTFLASEVTHMVKQTDSPILWFNNEEQGDIVLTRCYQAALGLTIHELMKDRDTNERKFQELTNGNIKIYDSASIHRRDVERICESHRPALIVFDQIDKLQGFVGDREDLRLGNVYQWARELAKGFAPVIGITQADGGAEGKQWLEMGDVMNAKTAKQAEADAIIGIGKTHDPTMEFVRYINISKNKLFGDHDSLPELRHGRLQVMIQPEIARFKDLL